MFKIILAYFAVFGLFYFGITAFRACTGKEKLELAKLVAYSVLCSVLTVITLALFVITF